MKYVVSREKTIDASLQNIHKNVANLSNWNLWSPWACLDPEAKLDSREDYLSWESKFTGSGNMIRVGQSDNIVNITLQFIKPFKSTANVTFKLTAIANNKTNISWQMESKLPLFLIFFKKMFEVMIGRDFERGLNRLKYLAETGSVPCKIEFVDTPNTIAGFKIAGTSSSCHMVDIASSMHSTFDKLDILVNKAQIKPQKWACFCDKMKLTKQVLYYTAAVVYADNEGAKLKNSTLTSKTIPPHKAIKLVLHGNYDFMSDAWAGIYTHLRGLKLKINKCVPPYEIYLKSPNDTKNSNDYVTEIYMPVK